MEQKTIYKSTNFDIFNLSKTKDIYDGWSSWIIIINLNMYEKYSKEFYESERSLYSFFFYDCKFKKKVISLVRAHVFVTDKRDISTTIFVEVFRKTEKTIYLYFPLSFAKSKCNIFGWLGDNYFQKIPIHSKMWWKFPFLLSIPEQKNWKN